MIETSPQKEKLLTLIQQAEDALKSHEKYTTQGAKLALKDMICEAQKAVTRKTQLSFRRNREFYDPRPEEEILFATHRYTMVPPFQQEGDVYTHYGLEEALTWFNTQDMRQGGMEKLRVRAEQCVDAADRLMAQAKTGTAVGSLDEEAACRATSALEHVTTLMKDASISEHHLEHLAQAVVQVYDALRELRYSRILRTDTDPSTSLYLTQPALEQVKKVIETDVLVREQYDKITEMTRQFSLEDIEKAVSFIMQEETDYEELNRHFYLWSSTDKIVNFKAPKDAERASISFVLPSVENEQDGLGHVWIDNVQILSASGASLDIHNAGFDEGEEAPFDWNPIEIKGHPQFRWESEYPYCGGGDRCVIETANPSSQVSRTYKSGDRKRSLFICNPTGQDEGAWGYTHHFPIVGDMNYTLTFEAKLDGKLKHGLKAIITYQNAQGQSAGQYEYQFNRKSSIPGGRFQLAMQCDAIQYAFTQDLMYAHKVKNAILYMLHDFCQGAEHWMVMNLRPEGSDSYGAVQCGRLLCAVAVSYSFIRQTDVFSSDDKEKFYGLVDYLLRYVLDLRDRTEWTPYEAQEGCSNWQTDMCAGAGFMMMILTDFPNRLTWLYNADAVLRAQLDLNVNADCSWPESIRYHHAALERFAGYAKVAHNVLGENWFETTPLASMFGYSIEMQTPGYTYFEGRVGTPPFGDHMLNGGQEFGSFATYLMDIADVDPALADRMYYTWSAAGKPFKKIWGEGTVLENIMGQGNTYSPLTDFTLTSTQAFPQSGIYIFRKSFGTSKQSYFAIMSSPEPIGHGHLDQGSFVLYKNSVPLVMDAGIEGYFDSSTSWYISSYSHACMQFATANKHIKRYSGGAINLSAGTYSLERGWVDVPKASEVLGVSLGEATDHITIRIDNPEGQGRHIRHVTYVKEPDLYIIRDTVEQFEGQVQFNLPVAARSSVIENQRIYSEGHYGVDLETIFLTPLNHVHVEKGRTTAFFPMQNEEIGMMDYIRATTAAEHGFLTVLYPKEHEKPRLRTEVDSSGSIRLLTGVHNVHIQLQEGDYGVHVVSIEE
ncbi:heparinase II/III family protein [Paenibacillus sp. FSL R10-2734]|uniref:heparinase II/III domain-containing protein n=1 Tax=Paenibacillus sp. FSL R10-2734 TaxID=2954691 RepID=UPI0030DD78D4